MTLRLLGISEIDSGLANLLFENGFDDATPYSLDGESFLSMDDEDPAPRIEQLKRLGLDAVIN